MLFSIIVPIYNVEKYIKRCIDSLLLQTYADIEIILVNDESPDNCPQICEDYAKQDNRIVVLHKKNGGLSDARNKGLEVAKGDYIIFVDSDDYISTDTCEKFSYYANGGYDVLIGDAVVEGGNCDVAHINFKEKVSGQEFLKRSLQENKMPRAAVLNVYKRKFLLENNLSFKYGILHEDEQFTPRVFLKANSVIYTGIEFYHYIIRENSITTKTDKRKNIQDIYATGCELEQIYRGLGDNALKKQLLDTLVVSYLSVFQQGKIHQYGKMYIQKRFVLRNAKKMKTKLKAFLFMISPKLYFKINTMSKSKAL